MVQLRWRKRNKAVNEMRNFPFRRRPLFGYSKEVDNNHKIEPIQNDFACLHLAASYLSMFPVHYDFLPSCNMSRPTNTASIDHQLRTIDIRHHLRGFSMLASSQCNVDQYLLSNIKLYFSKRPYDRPSTERLAGGEDEHRDWY